MLILAVRDTDQCDALTREPCFANNDVKQFETLVSMSRMKAGLEAPVNPGE